LFFGSFLERKEPKELSRGNNKTVREVFAFYGSFVDALYFKIN